MDMRVVELYSERDIARLARRVKGWAVGLCLFAAAALGACVAMAALTTTANAQRMELASIAVSTVSGWIVIYCALFVALEGKRELTHARMLRDESRERLEGEVAVTGEKLRIRGSIRIRPVEVRSGGQTRRVLVCESRAKALAAAGARALYLANGYVAAYEVEP